jgi:hypothetical protein
MERHRVNFVRTGVWMRYPRFHRAEALNVGQDEGA